VEPQNRLRHRLQTFVQGLLGIQHRILSMPYRQGWLPNDLIGIGMDWYLISVSVFAIFWYLVLVFSQLVLPNTNTNEGCHKLV
jgi:hypothetical protein